MNVFLWGLALVIWAVAAVHLVSTFIAVSRTKGSSSLVTFFVVIRVVVLVGFIGLGLWVAPL